MRRRSVVVVKSLCQCYFLSAERRGTCRHNPYRWLLRGRDRDQTPPNIGSAQLAAKSSPVLVLNAGDGIGEHPTQVCRVRAVGLRRVLGRSHLHTIESVHPRRRY